MIVIPFPGAATRPMLALCAIGLFSGLPVRAGNANSELLWYAQPARHFYESLPLGNGRIGAMVFGGLDEERIVLNESSVWSGSREDSDRPDAYKALPEIRRLLLEGKNPEAEALVNRNFTCANRGSGQGSGANVPFGCYQVLGNLRLKFPGKNGVPDLKDYRRELDLSTGLARVRARVGGVLQTREHFISAPDEVFVNRIRAEAGGNLTFEVALDRPELSTTSSVGNCELLMTGTLNDGHNGKGITYAARIRVLTPDGMVSSQGGKLRVANATEALLLVAAATDYRGFGGRQLSDPLGATTTDLDRAAAKGFDALRSRQDQDHRNYFDRVALRFGPEQPSTASLEATDRRLRGLVKGGEDPALAALYFNFGRYLTISSSRPGGLPANLQGIWAEEIQTPWNGDWHLDINVQMNYWPAAVCGLSDLQAPLNQLIASLVEPGTRTATKYYNARGWVAHVITNPWGFTSPGEHASWGATTGGSAWLCQHLWTHFAFTQDRQFLAWAYPILKGSTEFYLDNLVELPGRKWLVTGPSNSPENAYRLPDGRTANVCLGPTIDMQQLRELFANTAQAAKLLGLDAGLQQELLAKRARLAPNQIGPDGRLQEWLQPYAETDPHHRHISHLYGLHPGNDITREATPDLAAAARKTLETRGDDGTGWSLAWKVNLWARLGDGEHAHRLLQMLLRPAQTEGMNYMGGGGSSVNLFCFHPPFQIDGNFGGASGISEMLLQSQPDTSEPGAEPVIRLLPALPKAWAEGSVRGFRARGGVSVDMDWADGKLTRAVLKSDRETRIRLRYSGTESVQKLKAGMPLEVLIIAR